MAAKKHVTSSTSYTSRAMQNLLRASAANSRTQGAHQCHSEAGNATCMKNYFLAATIFSNNARNPGNPSRDRPLKACCTFVFALDGINHAAPSAGHAIGGKLHPVDTFTPCRDCLPDPISCSFLQWLLKAYTYICAVFGGYLERFVHFSCVWNPTVVRFYKCF